MFRALLLLVKIAIVFLIIGAISVICVVTFVDPNKYKADISGLLEKATNRKVNIYGNLQWSLTPHISINARNVSLGNLEGFDGPLLTIKDANVQIAPFELLKGKIVVNGLTVQGLAIKLTINEDGISNINDVISLLNASDSTPPKSVLEQNISSASAQSLLFKKVKLNKVKVIYENAAANSRWVANINATTENLVLKKQMKSLPPIYIEGEQIDIANPKYMRLQLKGFVQYFIPDSRIKLKDFIVHWNTIKSTIDGQLYLKDKKEELKISVNVEDFNQVLRALDLKTPNVNLSNLTLTTSLSADNDEIEINSFKLKLPNSERYTGHISIPKDYTAPISANIESNNGGIKSLQQLYDHTILLLARIHPVDSIIPKGREIKARVSGFNFKIDEKYSLTSAHSKVNYKNDLLSILSLSLEAANSSLQITGSLDFGKSQKAFFTIKSSNLSMEDACSMLGIENKLTGQAHAIIQLSADNLDYKKWYSNSSGKAEVDIEHGSFYGYNVDNDIKAASSDLKSIDGHIKNKDDASLQRITTKDSIPTTNNLGNKTLFNKALLEFSFTNGRYDVEKINVIGNNFNISGDMLISLPEQQISAKLNFITSALDEAISLDLKNVKTNFFVGGTPSSPTFLLDTTRVINRSAWLLQRNQDQEQTQEMIKNLINSSPNSANENATETTE